MYAYLYVRVYVYIIKSLNQIRYIIYIYNINLIKRIRECLNVK